VAKDAVHAFLGHVLDAFLLSTVSLATDSERRRNSNPRKAYPVDPGLIQAFDLSGRSKVGHALETVVLGELERRKAEVGYVRTADGYEVDFLARYLAGGEELIQVCAETTSPDTLQRELRALAAAAPDHARASQQLLVISRDQVPPLAGSTVQAQPAYEWLLEAPKL
jgi:hypothetical protein